MKINRNDLVCLFVNLILTTCNCNVHVYKRQFKLKSHDSLSTNYKILYTGNGKTFSETIHQCARFCSGDRRCVGIEVCQISEILYRCRACCEWIKLEEGSVTDGNASQCKYLEMVGTWHNFYETKIEWKISNIIFKQTRGYIAVL